MEVTGRRARPLPTAARMWYVHIGPRGGLRRRTGFLEGARLWSEYTLAYPYEASLTVWRAGVS